MKRRWVWLGIALILCIGIAYLVPTSRLILSGIVAKEPTYRAKPTRYWIHNLTESPESFKETVEILKRDPAKAVPMLMQAVDEPDPERRRTVALALAAMGTPAVPPLIAALKDENDLVRINAARALLYIGAEAHEAIPALAEAMADEVPLVAKMAIAALGRIGEKTVPILDQALRERSEVEIRESILNTLESMGPKAAAAVPTMLAIVKDTNSPLYDAASDALRRVDPQAARTAGVP